MDIILTHERTDFDGLASLLGAYLLDEELIPVLPRQLNRNVEAFLNLYGVELPFMDPRDLTGDPISSVTLVDTQSLISVKGMSSDTKVRVIDHHSLGDDVPEEWEMTIEETGATTTIFVEAIKERDLQLTPIQATLLLLGIYEDTGSLTYTRTSPSDIHAAGCLVEEGGSLAIVTDYLNHPLSLDQQKVYEELRANAESRIIHGHSVIIAQADAQELDAELSTLAHKLRDLLDPDAIFLLLETSAGVQMIARSNDDQIDVSAVLEGFETGGGHPRAAAALIKDGDVDEIYTRLQDILPDYIEPAITAKKIMSRNPQTIPPDMSVQKASEMMVRYGYEGFPVVEDGEIAGLLTRRAVDRALAHGLNLSVSSLMEAGNVRVFPSDSLEHIQNVMTDTGWGQIPVVTSRSKTIVGIVTRTDLLKILAPSKPTPGRQNLAARLEAKLPPMRVKLLQKVAEIAQERKDALYIVGGFVRDLLLEYPSLDFDLVVEGDAIALSKAIQEEFGGRVTSHSRFGTAKWFLNPEMGDNMGLSTEDMKSLPEALDFISARTEFYTHPTALPTVERGSIKLDLHRRDFTINTLALRLDGRHYGELYDYWGGLSDLKQGLIRVLHSLSFVDDPTRILRAVRYEQRYAYEIEERTRELLLEAKSLLKRVSGDRIRHEFDRIFDEENAAPMMERLHELNILEAVHPDLLWNDDLFELIDSIFDRELPKDWEVEVEIPQGTLHETLIYTTWLMQTPEPTRIIKRLKLTSLISQIILEAVDLQNMLPALMGKPHSEITSRLDQISNVAIYAVYLSRDKPEQKGLLSRYLSSWQHVSSHISGQDLKDRGLPPGPRYSEILENLRNAWIDGEVSTEKEEKALLERMLSEEWDEEITS